MNSTTSATQITITTAQPKVQPSIKQVTVYDARGRAKQIEKLRGVQI